MAALHTVAVGTAAPPIRRLVGPTAWIVLEHLHAIADSTEECAVAATSVRSLSETLGFGKDTVARALRVLRQHRLLVADTRRTDDGRFGRIRYLLATPPDVLSTRTEPEPGRALIDDVAPEQPAALSWVPLLIANPMPSPAQPAPSSANNPPSPVRSPSAKRRARTRVVDGTGQLSLLGDV